MIDPPFARLSDPTGPSLIIEPNGPQDIGEHDMVLVVSLEDFAPPNPPKINIQFKIEITGCQITFLSIESPSPSQYFYDILSPSTL